MGGRWDDLDNPPLTAAALGRHLSREAFPVSVRVVRRTGSTNTDLRAAAVAGAAEGSLLLAEEQTAGRGRHGRTWTAPAGAGLTFSLLLRPAEVPPARWGWLPLLTGVAVAAGLSRVAEVDAGVKWPNDLLLDGRKLGGILVERVESPGGEAAAVVGIGLNVALRPEHLPTPAATSLLVAGAACTDRLTVFRAVVRELLSSYVRWRSAAGDPTASGLRAAYRARSATLGRDVRVDLPDGATLTGVAVDVDETGALVVQPPDGPERRLSAGAVTHLRLPDP